jgi:curli production assembly/transport component CsgG
VLEAIEAALVHLLVQGIKDNHWALRNPQDFQNPLIQSYLKAQSAYLTKTEAERLIDKSEQPPSAPSR